MKKALMLLWLLFLAGCPSLDRDNLVGSFCSGSGCYKNVEKHKLSSESNRSAKIGFIEFNDHGFQKDRQAVKNIFENISNLNHGPSASPLLMIVFIHGWHHNASPSDANVKSFENFLKNIQYEEDNVSFSSTKRQVVGIYIGWRGESNESILNPLTYQSRKLAGLRVGQYGLQEVLAELSLIRKANDKNRLVAIGHSFGGGVLYSAVMQNLVDSVVSADLKSGTPDIIGKAYGDLVILMNPALEAARVEVLNRRLSEATAFNACQPLVLASFTSEKDDALSDAFPKGQSIFFGDDIKVAGADGYQELVTSSYGNLDSFKTHELQCENCTYSEEPEFLTRDQYVAAFKEWNNFRSGESEQFTVDKIKLSPYTGSNIKSGSPLMNVYVRGNNIIADHNAIWGGEFSRFARALIGMEFAKQNKCSN